MMEVATSVIIQAPKQTVWDVVTDIEHAATRIEAIALVEVLEKPEQGIVGLRWKETRTMMGKAATETIQVTDAVESDFYRTRAESNGAVYTSSMELEDRNGATDLTIRFHGQPVTLMAKVFWTYVGFMFIGGIRKALAKDLEDIKADVEAKTAVA